MVWWTASKYWKHCLGYKFKDRFTVRIYLCNEYIRTTKHCLFLQCVGEPFITSKRSTDDNSNFPPHYNLWALPENAHAQCMTVMYLYHADGRSQDFNQRLFGSLWITYICILQRCWFVSIIQYSIFMAAEKTDKTKNGFWWKQMCPKLLVHRELLNNK